MSPLSRLTRPAADRATLPTCPTCGETILDPGHSVHRAGGAHHAECVLYAWRSDRSGGRQTQPARPVSRA